MNTNQIIKTILTALSSLPMSAEQCQAETAWLLKAVCNLTWADVLAHPDREIADKQTQRLQQLLQQRVQERMPLQYLLQEAWFYGLKLRVTPDVLIPRPETELLVDQVLKIHEQRLQAQTTLRSILELGTGSGCIALALARHLPTTVQITATDFSAAALTVAMQNAQSLDLGNRIGFLQGDWLEPVQGQQFDVIVSNPPYIDRTLWQTLAPEVRAHEPAMALFPPEGPEGSPEGNHDAYLFYRRLAAQAQQHLNSGGHVAKHILVEVGDGMAATVAQLFSQAGLLNIQILNDLSQRPRVVWAQRGPHQGRS